MPPIRVMEEIEFARLEISTADYFYNIKKMADFLVQPCIQSTLWSTSPHLTVDKVDLLDDGKIAVHWHHVGGGGPQLSILG